MAVRWVLNASPLILLSKIDQQHLFTKLASVVVIPEAVAVEINTGPLDDPARLFLASSPFPIVPTPAHPTVLAWDLGAGETAVLSYALIEPECRAVLDDQAARRCARVLAVPVIGTLGIILRARHSHLIPAAAPLLRALQAAGIRLDEHVIRKALRETSGEDWE